MYKSQVRLLTQKRFLPLFLTQFFGAFNDNLFKNAIVVLITFIMSHQVKIPGDILVTLAASLLIIPMFLFSAQAGAIADKYEKSNLVRKIKFIEIILMIGGAIGFLFQNIPLLMFILFCMGAQSTFFGPIKYGVLPTFLEDDELIGGTALIEISTFLAILLGNILGVYIISFEQGLYLVSGCILLFALAGYISSRFMPEAKAPVPDLAISVNLFKETFNILRYTLGHRNIILCILGISWFWAVGFTYLAQFPYYVKNFIGGNQHIFVLFLTLFSIGVGLGAAFCNRLLKGRIEATFVPIAALLLSLFTFDLFHLSPTSEVLESLPLVGLAGFFNKTINIRITFDILMIAICGGVYVVPLYAMLQHLPKKTHKARMIAANNILNSFFMALAAFVSIGLLHYGLNVPDLFFVVGLVNLGVMCITMRLLPGRLIRSFLRIVLQIAFRIEVNGLQHLEKAGNRVVIIANHTSFLDGVILAAFLPTDVSFAIDKAILAKWWVRPLKRFADTFAVDRTEIHVIRHMVNYVKSDNKLVIFPEGRITLTGSLMKIYEGPGLVADKADATILPVLIEGAQYSRFSRLKGKVRLRWFPKITVTVFPHQTLEASPTLSPRKRRQEIGEKLYELMSETLFKAQDIDSTLFQSLLDAREIHGNKHIIMEDINRKPLNYKKMVTGSVIIGSRLAKITEPGEAVGLLLPILCATAVCFFGLQAFGRITAMLNFSSGSFNVEKACETAKIKTVVTARAFVEQAKLDSMIQNLESQNINICYLEDLTQNIHLFTKLIALLRLEFPTLYRLNIQSKNANQPAVILFTSGSEGLPKAVVLSNRNIQANKTQLSSRVDFVSTDIVLNALPMFHSFGLTAATLLPILYGMRVFFYPSPLHYRIIPEVCYEINATILFGTNTFLSAYARFADPYDFYSVRYVYAGAEKLKEENRRIWADKFGVRIFEGYGATETSPVISANTPMHNKPGSVGKLLPGITYRLETVPDIETGGKLLIKGPNVMLGYMHHDNPGKIDPPIDGWYDTGDIVRFDDEGYITIEGRAKRFAKIGGEMISLSFVESMLDELWPDDMHAVINQPDPKKGEQLVLVTTREDARFKHILDFAMNKGITDLAVPKNIVTMKKLPLLGSGKVNYPAIKEMLD